MGPIERTVKYGVLIALIGAGILSTLVMGKMVIDYGGDPLSISVMALLGCAVFVVMFLVFRERLFNA